MQNNEKRLYEEVYFIKCIILVATQAEKYEYGHVTLAESHEVNLHLLLHLLLRVVGTRAGPQHVSVSNKD